MSLNRPFKKYYMGIMLLKNTSEKTERQKRLLLQVLSITAKYLLYKEHSCTLSRKARNEMEYRLFTLLSTRAHNPT